MTELPSGARAVVVTASNRASSGVYEDRSGQLLARGLAGTAGGTLIVNLPGSTGGVKDALAVLGPLLPHVVSQLRGGDHARPA